MTSAKNQFMGTFFLFGISLFCFTSCETPPHIVFILADDVGWNDVGWRNPLIKTPNLDRMAHAGIILNNSYMQPLCTPSRSSILTGYYPFHIGLQHAAIFPGQPKFIPEDVALLPEKLKKLGYSTHIVGKWHVGDCDWKYTPTYRGFDSFMGFYTGVNGYFNFTTKFAEWVGPDFGRIIGVESGGDGYDFRFNEFVYYPKEPFHSTDLYAEQAVDIINVNDPNKTPLFLYLAFQTPHFPLEVPKRYEDMYADIESDERRIYSGMMTALDDAIGRITDALERKGYMKNTLIVFLSDDMKQKMASELYFKSQNGGDPWYGGNNLPLRGSKSTLWEGGTRVPGFVYSQTLLKETSYVNTELIHAVDWFPTLLSVAGGKSDPGIDGIDQWSVLRDGALSKRTEMIYNINDVSNSSAIRLGDFKLIEGSAGLFSDWYPILNSTDIVAISRVNKTVQLYNIKDDPEERNDIASVRPDIVLMLQNRIQKHRKTLVKAQNPPISPAANPENFGGVWTPGWCKKKYY